MCIRDRDETWADKIWFSLLSRLPLINLIVSWSGEFKGKIDFEAIPEIKIINTILGLVKKSFDDREITNKDYYRAIEGMLILLGVAGTKQVSQIIVAPDFAGFGSIGDDLGLTYDPRRNHQKALDAIQAFDGEIGDNDIEALAQTAYGYDYKTGDAQYKANKRVELTKYVAVTGKFGTEDEFVNLLLGKRNNNEVKGYVAESDFDDKKILDYSRPVYRFGTNYDTMSRELRDQLLSLIHI